MAKANRKHTTKLSVSSNTRKQRNRRSAIRSREGASKGKEAMNMHTNFTPASTPVSKRLDFTARPDPILAKIAAHQVAKQKFEDVCGYEDDFSTDIAQAFKKVRDEAGYTAATTAYQRASAAEKRAYKTLLGTTPTTTMGAAAFAIYVAKNENIWLDGREENACVKALKAIAAFLERPNMQASGPVDQLVSIKMEMDSLQARFNTLDEMKGGDDTSEGTYRQNEKDQLADRIEIMRDYLSTIPATTPAGAIVQVEALAILQDQTASSILTEFQEKASDLRCKRLLYSISSALRKSLPGSVAAKIKENDAHLNPWYRYEKRLDLIGHTIK